nr:RNA-dependent RNA polymerase [Narnavirus sp.]
MRDSFLSEINLTSIPRDLGVGLLSKGYSRWLPVVIREAGYSIELDPIGSQIPLYGYILPDGDLLRARYRAKQIGSYWKNPSSSWTDTERDGLNHILSDDIGLGASASRILLDRGVKHFLRIQDFINGVVDAFWLADPRFFLIDRPSQRQICPWRRLIRKIIKVGTYNLDDLVSQWKQFSLYLRNVSTEAMVSDALSFKDSNNIFKVLLERGGYLHEIMTSGHSIRKFQILSHLFSTRHLPYMGKRIEEKALDTFKTTLLDRVDIPVHLLAQLEHCAKRIGAICRKLCPGIPDGAVHISLDSSGEYSHTISKGGQAAAVWSRVKEILLQKSVRDDVEETPFGPVKHVPDMELWRYLYRDEPVVDGEFDGPRLSGVPKDRPATFQGLDEVLGKQLLYVAWKDYRPCPVDIRASTVSELGNKARIITVSPYWVNMLQAPLSHMLKTIVKWHPSCYSTFFKQDQTWAAAQQMVRIKDRSLASHAVLSSDLKSATDTIDFRLARRLVRAFMEGAGIPASQYSDLAISMIGPRRVHVGNDSYITKRGVMMGESLAKPVLTLLNLSIEELAYLSYHKWPIFRNHNSSPHSDWRMFHLGGDDHVAKGPLSYLNKITRIHKAVGSQVSPDKHALSRVAVTYCERVLFVKNLDNPRVKPIGDNHDDSLIVDSVKVRLMTKGLSTALAKDEKNVAIGKARQLAGALRWLPGGPWWSVSHKISIRDLFIKRMRGLLPSRHKSQSLYYHTLLPIGWGGLDLWVDTSELYNAYRHSPPLTQWLFYQRSIEADVDKPLKIFRRLNTNSSRRGVPEMQALEDMIVEDLELMKDNLDTLTWEQVKELVGPCRSNREVLDRARDKGYLSFRDFAEYCSRGDVFTRLLLGEISQRRQFNTTPLNKAYKRVWSAIADEFGPIFPIGMLTEEEVLRVVHDPKIDRFLNVESQTFADFGHRGTEYGVEETCDFRMCSFMEAFTAGKPSLIIGKDFISYRPTIPEGT